VPCRLARGAADVWISARSERRKPSLSASRIATATPGNIQAFAQEVDADQHIESARRRSRMIFDALDGFDIGVQVAHL